MRSPQAQLPSKMKYFASLLVVASFLVPGAANAKCSVASISHWFSEAGNVVLVSITDVRDGPVPWPYGLQKGALPGKLLIFRVLKSWKGSLHPGDIVYGWTQAPGTEDAYPITDIGTHIIVYGLNHEIEACNTAPPAHQNEVSEELDAIVQDHATPSSASKACSFLKERISVHDGVPPDAVDKRWSCNVVKDYPPYNQNPLDWWVIELRSSRQGHNRRGWFAVNRLTNEVRAFDMHESNVGDPIDKP